MKEAGGGGGGWQRKTLLFFPTPFGCGLGLSLLPSRSSRRHATLFPQVPSSWGIALCDVTKNDCAGDHLG